MMGFNSLRMAVVSLAFAGVATAQTAAEVQIWDTTWAQYQALEAIPLPQRGVVVASQDLTVIINADVKDVFDIYSNVNNALGLHPFLASLSPIRHTRNRLDFIAYENIPLPDGTIYPGVTVAQQRFHRSRNFYDADTYDVPGIVTHQHITFTRLAKNQTQVVEHLTFEAPAIYIELAVQGGVYAHYFVQQGLKAKIEAGLLKPVRFPRWLPAAGDDDGDDDEGCDD